MRLDSAEKSFHLFIIYSILMRRVQSTGWAVLSLLSSNRFSETQMLLLSPSVESLSSLIASGWRVGCPAIVNLSLAAEPIHSF